MVVVVVVVPFSRCITSISICLFGGGGGAIFEVYNIDIYVFGGVGGGGGGGDGGGGGGGNL